MDKERKRNLSIACLLSFLLTAGLLTVLYAVNGYAPFGDSASLACRDANNQYLDFFLYYKRLISGTAGFSYSFSKMLGGTNVALFAYYLASPLNLLIAFFPTDRILFFFDLLILLKLSLAAASCALFLGLRFPASCSSGWDKRYFVVLLSACYALSQYAVSQCSNVMWLDGLILLPLILLGVWYIVNGGPLWRLTVPTALAILFNWYTAGICCLFSAGWFVVEAVLSDRIFTGDVRHALSTFSWAVLRYVFAVLLGVLCSAGLFFPVVVAMSSTAKGQLHWLQLFDPSLRASVWSILESSVYGGVCTSERLSLYCGALPLVGTLSLFAKKRCSREKVVVAAGLVLLVLMFCWTPLYTLFNLMANPTSFFCRFSFVQIFALVFSSGLFLLKSPEKRANTWLPGLLYAGLLVLVFLLDPYENPLQVYLTASMIVLVALSLHGSLKAKKSFCVLTCLLVILDLAYHTQVLFDRYHQEDGTETLAYIDNQQKLIRELGERDPGIYRISQLKNRDTTQLRRSAVYDEAQAYGYRSITEYSSTADDSQLAFLQKAGYRNLGNMMSIVNTSILGIDSLLGVKYVLSDYPIHGLTEEPDIFSFDGKKVYQNPCALPLAFTISTEESEHLPYKNPFQYQNALFSALTGEQIVLYQPVYYEKKLIGNPTDEDRTQVFTLTLPEGNFAIYGNLPWEMADYTPVLDLNGRQQTLYAAWLGPNVFYIPADPGDSVAVVSLQGDAYLAEGEEQFYALDLDMLKTVTDRLKAQGATEAIFDEGHVSVHTDAEEGEKLFLSIPCSPGWSVTVNGTPVEPELFADLFYTVPLSGGSNNVELRFQVPGLKIGLITSAASTLFLISSSLASIRKQRDRTRESRINREISMRWEQNKE